MNGSCLQAVFAAAVLHCRCWGTGPSPEGSSPPQWILTGVMSVGEGIYREQSSPRWICTWYIVSPSMVMPPLSLFTLLSFQSLQCTAECRCRVIKAEMVVFTRGCRRGRCLEHTTDGWNVVHQIAFTSTLTIDYWHQSLRIMYCDVNLPLW